MGREGRGGLCCLCWGFQTLNKWIPIIFLFQQGFLFFIFWVSNFSLEFQNEKCHKSPIFQAHNLSPIFSC
jgi:hypothetical protein